jgi:hypothetical protein
VYSGTAAVLESQFLNNGATGGVAFRFSGTGLGEGGAVYNRGVLQISNCSFSTNEAKGGFGGHINEPGQGGGLYNGGTAILNGSTWHHNSARGGYAGAFGSPIASFPGGHAQGGAMFNSGNLFATNCTLAWNQAEAGDPSGFEALGGIASGGGIYNSGSNLVLMNVTIARNSVVPATRSPDPRGANLANTNGVLSLRNSLVAYGNGALNAWGTITDDGFNMSSDGSCAFASGSSFNFTDPKLDELANYGGPTLTMALLPQSPAIDFGTTVGAPSIDQRGMSRPFGDGVDMGAFERGVEQVRLFIRVVGPMVEVSFTGQAGKTYALHGSIDLGAWETLETIGPLAASGIITRTLPTERAEMFFRLQSD